MANRFVGAVVVLGLAGCGSVNVVPDADLCPFTDCNGDCIDTNVDRANCGACGNTCDPGEVCSAGACDTSCQAGLTECTGSCVDAMSDPDNCGTCGNACGTGRFCSAGTCTSTCAAPLVRCGNTCIDPMTSLTNCGATASCTGATAGTVCVAGQQCSAGACAYPSMVQEYSDQYVAGLQSVPQCTNFNNYRASLVGAYSKVTFSGSVNTTGVVCADPTFATQLAGALNTLPATGTATVVTCNGVGWQVCNRGNYYEFWVGTTTPCNTSNCPATGYMLRPCFTGNAFWGGIDNGAAGCSPPTQTLTVKFER